MFIDFNVHLKYTPFMYPKIEKVILEKFGTASAFALAIGFSKSSVSHWLTGKRKPSLSALQTIATATNGEITPNDWLINWLIKGEKRDMLGVVTGISLSPKFRRPAIFGGI